MVEGKGPTAFVEKTLLTLLNDCGICFENYLTIHMKTYFWALYSIP